MLRTDQMSFLPTGFSPEGEVSLNLSGGMEDNQVPGSPEKNKDGQNASLALSPRPAEAVAFVTQPDASIDLSERKDGEVVATINETNVSINVSPRKEEVPTVVPSLNATNASIGVSPRQGEKAVTEPNKTDASIDVSARENEVPAVDPSISIGISPRNGEKPAAPTTPTAQNGTSSSLGLSPRNTSIVTSRRKQSNQKLPVATPPRNENSKVLVGSPPFTPFSPLLSPIVTVASPPVHRVNTVYLRLLQELKTENAQLQTRLQESKNLNESINKELSEAKIHNESMNKELSEAKSLLEAEKKQNEVLNQQLSELKAHHAKPPIEDKKRVDFTLLGFNPELLQAKNEFFRASKLLAKTLTKLKDQEDLINQCNELINAVSTQIDRHHDNLDVIHCNTQRLVVVIRLLKQNNDQDLLTRFNHLKQGKFYQNKDTLSDTSLPEEMDIKPRSILNRILWTLAAAALITAGIMAAHIWLPAFAYIVHYVTAGTIFGYLAHSTFFCNNKPALELPEDRVKNAMETIKNISIPNNRQ